MHFNLTVKIGNKEVIKKEEVQMELLRHEMDSLVTEVSMADLLNKTPIIVTIIPDDGIPF